MQAGTGLALLGTRQGIRAVQCQVTAGRTGWAPEETGRRFLGERVVLAQAVVPEESDQARGKDAVCETAEMAAAGPAGLVRPVPADGLQNPQHGVLAGVLAVGLLQPVAGGVLTDELVGQRQVTGDQLVAGRAEAVLLG